MQECAFEANLPIVLTSLVLVDISRQSQNTYFPFRWKLSCFLKPLRRGTPGAHLTTPTTNGHSAHRIKAEIVLSKTCEVFILRTLGSQHHLLYRAACVAPQYLLRQASDAWRRTVPHEKQRDKCSSDACFCFIYIGTLKITRCASPVNFAWATLVKCTAAKTTHVFGDVTAIQWAST